MPTLKLNGQPYPFNPGATILEAAQQNGVRIPSLCNHPELKPAGMCRMCLVEVEGLRGFQTACTTKASEGMAVRTNTPDLLDMRREVLSLILSEHPYTCLMCERHERCDEWQVTIRKAAVTTGCENCPKNGQCELQSLVDEVGLSLMPYCISYRGLPVLKEDPFFDRDYNLCILCGRCVRVCQDVRRINALSFVNRGAQTLVSTAFGQPLLESGCEFCGACVDICPTGALYDRRTKWEGLPEKTVTTVCPYCSVGCQLDLWVKDRKITGVRPSQDGSVNQGQACARGRFGLVDMVHSTDRLRTPLLRKSGQLAQVSWDEAFAFLAEKLPAYRGEAFTMLLSPHLTSEAASLLGQFARQAMGSENVDITTGLPRIPRLAELVDILRSILVAPIRSILEAGSIFVLGANPALSHPIVDLYIRQAQARGAKLVVVDPRRTELARRADAWLQVEPGKDGEVIGRLSDLRSGTSVIIFGSGITHYPDAPDTVRAIIDLARAFEPEAGLLPLVGPANLLGTIQAGAAALSGSRDYPHIIQSIGAGKVKALYLAGELPPLDDLKNLDLLVVQDSFLSPQAAELAHVVLPAASFAESSGTLTNLEGLPQHFEPAIPPLAESRPDEWIAAQLLHSAEGWEKGTGEQWAGEQGIGDKGSAIGNQGSTIVDSQSAICDQQSAIFNLLVERNAFSYRGSALTERVHGMERVKSDEGTVALNPADAAELGLQEGETARVNSENGSDTLRVRLSPELPARTAYTSINPVHGSALFPARLPEVKAYRVAIEKSTN